MKVYKVGLVGLKQAQRFIEMFNGHPQFEVTALCDVDEALLNRVGEEAGISRRFTDYRALAESDLDVVGLSTPIQVHGQQSIMAMRNGKHVLCQYIAASNPKEGEELLRSAEDSGKRYMFIETDCYERKNRIMTELARRGVLGDLYTGTGDYIHDCGTMGCRPDGSLTWRGRMWMDNQGGNVLAVHTAMPLLNLFGERVKRVSVMGPGSHTLPQYRWNDAAIGLCRFPSGRMIELRHAILAHRPVRCGYYLQGTKGCFDLDRAAVLDDANMEAWGHMKEGSWMSLDELEQTYELETTEDHAGHGSAWHMCVRDFMDAVVDGTRPPMDLYDALHITAIGWAAEESMEKDRVVDVIQYD